MPELIELRDVWHGPDDLYHAVTLKGHWDTRGPHLFHTHEQAVTDCGIRLPFDGQMSEHVVTCEDCLWGSLDPVLAEPVPIPAAIGRPHRVPQPVPSGV